jgi:hypothetical protein
VEIRPSQLFISHHLFPRYTYFGKRLIFGGHYVRSHSSTHHLLSTFFIFLRPEKLVLPRRPDRHGRLPGKIPLTDAIGEMATWPQCRWRYRKKIFKHEAGGSLESVRPLHVIQSRNYFALEREPSVA